MNGYLEVKVSDLRKAWNNYKVVRDFNTSKYVRWQAAYKKEFGKEPLANGVGDYSLFRELVKCKENASEPLDKGICHLVDGGFSCCIDPSPEVKKQRNTISCILLAASDEDAKVLLDVDLCQFVRRWKDGGAFMLKEDNQ